MLVGGPVATPSVRTATSTGPPTKTVSPAALRYARASCITSPDAGAAGLMRTLRFSGSESTSSVNVSVESNAELPSAPCEPYVHPIEGYEGAGANSRILHGGGKDDGERYAAGGIAAPRDQACGVVAARE